MIIEGIKGGIYTLTSTTKAQVTCHGGVEVFTSKLNHHIICCKINFKKKEKIK